MLELDVKRWQPHTLKAAGTLLGWRMLVHTCRGNTFLVLVLVFMATPAFAESGGGHSLFLTASFVLVMMAPTMWFMYRAYENSRFGVRAVTNDNPAAIDHFNEALSHASTELLIHDDGDQVEGTVYNDDATIEAVRMRLEKYEKLKIKCLFNFNQDVKMTELCAEFKDRFEVRYSYKRPSDDVHFKIADRGKWAYLSTHPQGDRHRDGEICDGTRANKRVRQRFVGDLIRAFDDGFKDARLS